MKIVLTTTFLITILTIGILGINNNSNNIVNAFAQEGAITPEGLNNTMSTENVTQWTGNATLAYAVGNDTSKPMNATLAYAERNETKPMNATLAYAQGDGTMGENDTSGMTAMSNQSKAGEGIKMMSLNGTINVKSTVAEAFKSKVTTDIIGAIQAAQASVGPNSVVKEAELTEAHGYLVYKITAVDENMKKYKVIVDPGNGQVLMKKDVTWYDEYKKMKHGDKKYDKYGGHDYKDDYDAKKKMMMMKDKKY